MSPRQEQIMSLLREGHCVRAIACKLGIPYRSVRSTLDNMGVLLKVVPPDHLTLCQAAKLAGVQHSTVSGAAKRGELTVVTCAGVQYCTKRALHNWMTNFSYRQQAKAVRRRLFQRGRPKPGR